MDYIKEMNAFYDLDMANQLTPNAISLYFALLNIANKLYWRADFTASNIRLQSKAGISNRKTLDRARNQLIQKGLVSYKQSGNQAGSYTIFGCVGQIMGKNVPTGDRSNVPEGVPESVHINNLNKTNLNKNKNIYAHPDGARVLEKTNDEQAAALEPEPKDTLEGKPKTEKPRKPFTSKKQEHLFDRFWEQYPKKRNKGTAERAWVKIRPSDDLFDSILAGLEKARGDPNWTKDGGQFIPYPSTWLNAKGWEDEYAQNKKAGGDDYFGYDDW